MVNSSVGDRLEVRAGGPVLLSRWVASVVGVVAVGVALGLGDLVAGLTSVAASPFLAVGAQFIRLTPEWLKEFATSTFATNDKLVLLLSMAVVIAVVAVVAGLISRRRLGPGLVVVAVLGLVAIAATLGSPTFTALDLGAPLSALIAGTASFTLLHRLALDDAVWHGSSVRPGEAPAGQAGDGPRRRMLLSATALALGAIATGVGGRLLARGAGIEASPQAVGPLPAPAPVKTPPPPVVNADFADVGTPTWLTPVSDFYRIDTALQVPQIRVSDYVLRIHGMVERELRLSYDDLRARRLIEAPITMTCVSNEVGGHLISNAQFLGVSLRELLNEAGVLPGAQQIASTSADGWTSGTPVDVVSEPDRPAMLALGMNGKPLPVEHGFPVRMVVAGLYGYVSGCKWITDMELTTFNGFSSYWQQRGWSQQAPIKTQSRIDTPKSGANVAAGRLTVAGIAWAQHTGISGVQIRSDHSAWQPAELASDVSRDSWRMWRATITVPPGQHTLQVRATDQGGHQQTGQQHGTIPNGATGWHTISVTAA